MLEGVFRLVPVLLQGARTNYFGWGCPTYCSEPTWSVLILVFLVGLISGICLALLGLWTLWPLLLPPLSSLASVPPDLHASPNRHSALVGYLDAQRFSRRRQELVCSVGDLRITIQGPSASAASFLQKVLALGERAPRAASPSASDISFDLVSAGGNPEPVDPVPVPRQETRSEIEASFSSCPQRFLDLSAKLSGSSLSSEERIKRAWKAGQWAQAVSLGRVRSPNRTAQLDLRPRVYAVVRATGIESPTLCRSAGAYWEIVGDLTTSSSITHGFPSELEVKIYFAGAGISEYQTRA